MTENKMSRKLKATLYTVLFMMILVILIILIFIYPKIVGVFVLIAAGLLFTMAVYSLIYNELKH